MIDMLMGYNYSSKTGIMHSFLQIAGAIHKNAVRRSG